jgi:hypothetical protein
MSRRNLVRALKNKRGTTTLVDERDQAACTSKRSRRDEHPRNKTRTNKGGRTNADEQNADEQNADAENADEQTDEKTWTNKSGRAALQGRESGQ